MSPFLPSSYFPSEEADPEEIVLLNSHESPFQVLKQEAASDRPPHAKGDRPHPWFGKWARSGLFSPRPGSHRAPERILPGSAHPRDRPDGNHRDRSSEQMPGRYRLRLRQRSLRQEAGAWTEKLEGYGIGRSVPTPLREPFRCWRPYQPGKILRAQRVLLAKHESTPRNLGEHFNWAVEGTS
jgi:hypothetical protein